MAIGSSLDTVDVTQPGERGDGFIAVKAPYEKRDITSQLPRPRHYSPQEKAWLVPEGNLPLVVDHYRKHNMKVLINGIDNDLMREMRDRVPNLCHEDLEDRKHIIPPGTWARLLPYQQEGVNFGIRRRGRLLLADEPGLGKTVQAILIAAAFNEDWPLLIICPAAMRKVWENHLMEWLPQNLISPGCVHSLAAKKDAEPLIEEVKATGGLKKGHITIVSYTLMSTLDSTLRDKHKAVIVDESQMVKKSSAERTRAVRAVTQAADTRILISGSPMENRPIELYSQLNMVRPGLLGSRNDFGMRYCGGQKTEMHGETDYWGKSNQAEMHAVLRETILLRRKKADVLSELPEKFRCEVPVEISSPHQKELAELRKRMGPTPSQQNRGDGDEQLVNELRRKTGQAKVDGSIAHLNNMLANGHKVIFFAFHKAILDKVESAIKKANEYDHIRIDGDTPAAGRHNLCQRFQEDTKVRVALLSIKATGVGITLTAADLVIFAELDWQPTGLQQAEDRAHRVGQTKALQVHYMLAADHNSADELMWRVIKTKLNVVGQAMDGVLYGETGLQMGTCQPPGNAEPVLSTPEKEPSDQHRALGSQEMPGCPTHGMASPAAPADQGPTQPRVRGSQERDASPRGVKASQEKEAPGAPKKKRLKKALLYVVLSDSSDSDAEKVGRRAAKAGGPDYDNFTVEGMVHHKRSVAAKNESQKGTGEAELIDLTQESQEGSQPRRTTQFSREEQGPLADEDD